MSLDKRLRRFNPSPKSAFNPPSGMPEAFLNEAEGCN
jgi:hypothetical protein